MDESMDVVAGGVANDIWTPLKAGPSTYGARMGQSTVWWRRIGSKKQYARGWVCGGCAGNRTSLIALSHCLPHYGWWGE
jgi:hypothetical protein